MTDPKQGNSTYKIAFSEMAPAGKIPEMAPAALQTKFTGADFDEALRLVTLARYIKAKYSRGGDHVQAQA